MPHPMPHHMLSQYERGQALFAAHAREIRRRRRAEWRIAMLRRVFGRLRWGGD